MPDHKNMAHSLAKQHMMYLWREESVFWQFWKKSAMAWKMRPETAGS